MILEPPRRRPRRFIMVPNADAEAAQARADEALDRLARLSCADPDHDEAEAEYAAASKALAEARKRQRIAKVIETR